ncbi:hypothetical protein CCUG63695_01349 [Mycobacteroides franklinii]|uniref:Uncharacterized protein n=1 Tax=Mycobacteroides franklinii TaxID=948102 RepID=A0A4R8R4L7_9MYCO|nr:hypothetical protein CCUG64054_00349 [Mycobacteroides franklinii]TDZ48037.1 hypothetical protein CCUG63697_04333 [Mycobacteroides franklinii]TDZ60246.1 hypothetical protein CCUG63696_00352 [Mycobacteroides franklinii]TDZ65645.1 hypothetical protein CCUG63695_01349 [Mycobacteroides franklinii]TDZ73814.1 hypothetical protein CCUG64056_00349 [Mycobacteroides franklinii]
MTTSTATVTETTTGVTGTPMIIVTTEDPIAGPTTVTTGTGKAP